MIPLKTPVSLHVFNRPHLIKNLFDILRIVKPKSLFITADGPRDNFVEDKGKCAEVREIIEDNIDWECEVYKNYSKQNQGSYKSTSSGISWVFDQVDEAIILEDDCLPSPTFFRFCEELLDKYRKDTRMGAISGNNFILPGMRDYPYSYYYSSYNHIWGWATWKRAWNLVDLDMVGWDIFCKFGFDSVFRTNKEKEYWRGIFKSMALGGRQHWDYKMTLSMHMNSMLTILPSVNLVTNVGVGPDATNCKVAGIHSGINAEEMIFPLEHPLGVYKIDFADQYTEKHIFSGNMNLLTKLVKQLKRI